MKKLMAFVALLVAVQSYGAGCVPDAPGNVQASWYACPPGQVCIQSERVLVTWRDVARNEKGYVVERSVFDGLTWWPWELVTPNGLPKNSTQAVDEQPAGLQTVYRVWAVGTCGSSRATVVFVLGGVQ